MKAIVRRLHRLEERFNRRLKAQKCDPCVRVSTRHVLRCGLPPISPDSRAELKGMSIVAILNSGRQRAAWRARGSEKAAPEFPVGAGQQARTEARIG